ncbi:MAG: DUF2683 family protein [Bacteroidota bacterium]
METLIMLPENKKQIAILKAIAKALKIPFEKKQNAELSGREKTIELYGLDLVEAVERAEKSIKAGKVKTLDPSKTLWENIL